MAWGAVLACTAACTNFAGLVVVRTLLGVFECVCQPAFVFLFVQNSCTRVTLLNTYQRSTVWYTRDEQALVIGSFYSMNGFQQCVGGLIAYGIAQIDGAKIKNWQILFTVSTHAAKVSGGIDGFPYSYWVASRSFGEYLSCFGCQIVQCMQNVSPLKIDCSWLRGSEKMIPESRIKHSRLVLLLHLPRLHSNPLFAVDVSSLYVRVFVACLSIALTLTRSQWKHSGTRLCGQLL